MPLRPPLGSFLSSKPSSPIAPPLLHPPSRLPLISVRVCVCVSPSLADALSHAATDFVPSIHTTKEKKKKSIFKKVVKHGWCPWMFQLWRLCVVFLCCCRRVAVACPVCRRMYLLPPFLPSFPCRRLWCGADGDRYFLFFLQIAIHRPGAIKIVIENPCRVHHNPSCSCQKHQLDTRLQTAQRRARPLGKKTFFFL